MRAWTSLTIVATSLAVACGSSSHTSSEPGTDGGLDATHEGDDTSGSDGATELDGGASDAGDAGNADGATDADSASSSDAGGFACGNIVCNQDEVCVHQANGCMVLLRDRATAPPPYCWSPDSGSTLVCDEEGGISGVFDTLPPGTNLVCYSSCT